MNTLDKNIKKEIRLVNSALKSDFNKEKIKSYLSPIVFSIAESFLDKYIKKEELILSKEEKNDVLKEVWKYLNFALNKYDKKTKKMLSHEIEAFSFSEYFAWFVKQSLLEYLQKNYISK